VEEAGVEGLEDFVEVVVMALGRRDAFATAGLTDVLGLFGDGFGADVAAVAVGVDGGDGLLVELGEEDVGDGVVDGFGCVLEEIGEMDLEAAFAEADGGVEGGEAAEADVEWRDRRAGAEVAVLLLEDGDQGGHFSYKFNISAFACRRLCGGVRRDRWAGSDAVEDVVEGIEERVEDSACEVSQPEIG
jgi:hypothetical protein